MELFNSVYNLPFDTAHYAVDKPVYVIINAIVSRDTYTAGWNTIWTDVTERIDMMLDSNLYALTYKIIEKL